VFDGSTVACTRSMFVASMCFRRPVVAAETFDQRRGLIRVSLGDEPGVIHANAGA
jgi:hypothetical protein